MIHATFREYAIILPTSWQEVTLKQFARLFDKCVIDEAGNISFDPYVGARCLVDDEEAYNQFEAGEIARLIEQHWYPVLGPIPQWEALAVPKIVAGIVPPDYIGSCTQLQVESVRSMIQERIDEGEPTDLVSLAVPTLATFLYPGLTGQKLVNTSQLAEITDIIEGLPSTEALPLAAFFLASLPKIQPTMRMSFVIKYRKPQRRTWLMRWFPNWSISKGTRS